MQTKARELLGNRRLVFGLNQGQATREDWDTFRELVAMAAEYGGTHIHVGQFPFRYGSWVLPDNDDPYSAWSNTGTALLRVCPPESIQEWVSADHAKWCQEFIRRQLEIMRPHGLKGYVSSVEPHWLPEGVYRAYPRWRGAQCELGRIALAPYFAPSIDEPEVLDLYAEATREFATQFPEVEVFEFLSNDSGGGVAWTPCIYPGMNGPPRHRLRDGGERVATWMNRLREAAGKAGVDARFNIFSSGFPPELRASVRAKLDRGVFLSNANGHGEALWGDGATLGGGLWHPAYPVVGLSNPEAFIGGLQGVFHNPDNDDRFTQIRLHESEFGLARQILANFVDSPGTGVLHRTQQLLDAATWYTGSSDSADALAACWTQIQQAIHATLQVRQKGFGLVFDFCTVSMRWLLRPLVPRPEDLTDEETAYYRHFMFAAGEEAKADPNFGMVLGKAVFNGESVMWMSRWCLHEAVTTLQGVRARLETIAGKLDGDSGAWVALLAARVRALACLALNARNCIMYQYALDIADQPQYGPNQIDYDDNIIYDQRALTLRKIAREELDNTADLIAILKHYGERVIDVARTPEEESVFRLGPDLVADLRRKMAIMLDHWQDYERLYPATKVWDFEPEPRGNLGQSGTADDHGLGCCTADG